MLLLLVSVSTVHTECISGEQTRVCQTAMAIAVTLLVHLSQRQSLGYASSIPLITHAHTFNFSLSNRQCFSCFSLDVVDCCYTLLFATCCQIDTAPPQLISLAALASDSFKVAGFRLSGHAA